MSGGEAVKAISNGMQDQAAAWIARLCSDSVSAEDRQQFALWLAANPQHRKAMDSMLDLWDDLAVVGKLPLEAAPARPDRRRWLGTGLALAASLVLALLLTPQLDFYEDQQIYRTRVGEQISVELADGSRISLNTNSQLQVKLDDDRRYIVLSRGEAYFEVAKDMQRELENLRNENADLKDMVNTLKIQLAARPVSPIGTDSSTTGSSVRPTPLPESDRGLSFGSARPPSPDSDRDRSGRRTHRLKKSETFYSLSRSYGVSVNALREANPGLNPNKLSIGQEIRIP